MAGEAAELAHVPDVKAIVTNTADDVVHFVEILAEWLVPVIGIVLGMFLGPKIFSGTTIGDALWVQGYRASNPTTGGANAFLIGTLAGAGIVGVAAGSLWHYQASRKGWGAIVARILGGFTIGWAIGILIGALNAYFVTGQTTSAQTFNSWLDNAISAWAIPLALGTTSGTTQSTTGTQQLSAS